MGTTIHFEATRNGQVEVSGQATTLAMAETIAAALEIIDPDLRAKAFFVLRTPAGSRFSLSPPPEQNQKQVDDAG